MNGTPAGTENLDGEVTSLEIAQEVDVPTGATAEIQWQITGGIGRDLEAAEKQVGRGIVDLDAAGAARSSSDLEWVHRTPELEFPDAPEIEAAYGSARAALRTLYTSPGDGLVGAVAGYPWYSAIWCRDLAVMLPALLWLGDPEWVAASLTSVFRFQSHRTIPILGAEPGELPMQVAPGPIFLYGTSDSTLRFPEVVEQYHRHSGVRNSVSSWADAMHRIVEWARARVDPGSGLFRHGNEAEAIGAAADKFAKVRYGIDAPDTTIWDSADRRDHAVDVQVLWWSTLGVTERMLAHAGDPTRARACHDEAERLGDTIRRRYVRSDGSYLFDTLRNDEPVDRVRPNALRVVSAGLLERGMATRVVLRAAAPDLTSAWGVRTLSSDDPGYNPQAYHDGQVWTIATAWAADAAFAVGNADLGLTYLRTIAARIASESGFANECYRGDRPEPFNSCYLLGFSVAPFLTVLFERLWGVWMDALRGRIRIFPMFPSSWRTARLRGLRVGDGHLDLDWKPGHLHLTWNGPAPLTVETLAGERLVPAGSTVDLDTGFEQA